MKINKNKKVYALAQTIMESSFVHSVLMVYGIRVISHTMKFSKRVGEMKLFPLIIDLH